MCLNNENGNNRDTDWEKYKEITKQCKLDPETNFKKLDKYKGVNS